MVVHIASADVTASVNLKRLLLFARAITHLARQVNIPCIKETVVNIVVECLFATHKRIRVINVDLVNGLPLQNQRCYKGIQTAHFLFRGHHAFARFRDMSLRLCVGFGSIINRFLKGTSVTLRAGITNIRRFESCNAYLFLKARAIVVTATAHFTVFQ